MPDDRGLLLFFAPAERVPALATQLEDLCRKAQLPTTKGVAEASFSVGPHAIGVLSWSSVVHRMLQAAQAQGDAAAVTDIDQLVGLCEYIENASFIRFSPEEVTALGVPHRMIDLTNILSALVDAGDAQGLWARGPFAASNCQMSYGIEASPFKGHLHFSASFWKKFQYSPLWIHTSLEWWSGNRPDDAGARLREALAYLGQKYVEPKTKKRSSPSRSSLGRSGRLVRDLLAQARELFQALRSAGLLGKGASAAGGLADARPSTGLNIDNFRKKLQGHAWLRRKRTLIARDHPEIAEMNPG